MLIDVADRGLQYGHGVFETLAIQAGKPELWDYHFERLMLGCQRLYIPTPKKSQLYQEILHYCDQTPAIIKIIITAGSGGRGYQLPQTIQPNYIITRHPWIEYAPIVYENGIDIRICQQRLASQPALAGIKHLNRLEQVMARAEWQDTHIIEGLMLNQQGDVIEGVMSNLFIVKNQQLQTADLQQCGVEGVMRRLILTIAKQKKIPCCIAPISLNQLQQADEVFICNSIRYVLPVKRCDQWYYAMGDITKNIMLWVKEAL